MPNEILPDLYQVQIPLPRSPLKATNSYIIRNKDRFFVIDSGWRREECRSTMLAAFAELNVEPKKTDYFITHAHSDHCGLLGDLVTDSSRVYLNPTEIPMANLHGPEREGYYRNLISTFSLNGFPENDARVIAETLPGRKYRLNQYLDYTPIKDGDIFDIGRFKFKAIETPGHSPAHMCLYDTEKKILVAGDHILADITPNITYSPLLADPLRKYLASLEKICGLDVDLVLTGHRSVVKNYRERVDEIRVHHRARINEIIAAISSGSSTAFEVTPRISWDIVAKSWDDFPPPQKWYAFGETLAHMIYLNQTGVLRCEVNGGCQKFSLA